MGEGENIGNRGFRPLEGNQSREQVRKKGWIKVLKRLIKKRKDCASKSGQRIKRPTLSLKVKRTAFK